MYTLFLNKDGNFITTNEETIMQRSLNVDNIQILVDKIYKNIDLSNATVYMEYTLPVSKRILGMYLQNSPFEDSNDLLSFTINGDTKITGEAGDIRFSLTFVKLDLIDEANPVAYVSKTQEGIIKITPIAPWLDYVPDELLTPIDQRLIALEAAQKTQNALNQEMFDSMARDIVLNEEHKKIQLESNSGPIGNGIDTNKLSDIIGTAIVGQDLDGVNDGVTHLDNIPGIQVVDLDKLVY